jgi:hypothetical protein
MPTSPATVTVWESGRLKPQASSRPVDFGRDAWIATASLTLSAIVLAVFVAVLERDVNRSEMAHGQQRARAVAEAQCEAAQPAESRGSCIALFNGDATATADAGWAADDASTSGVQQAPVNAVHAQGTRGRLTTASMTSVAEAR